MDIVGEIVCEWILMQSTGGAYEAFWHVDTWILACHVFWLVLKACLGVPTEFLGHFGANHMRFDLCNPHIKPHLPML